MMRIATILVATGVLLVDASASAQQSELGAISGRVTERSGYVLPGVTITVEGSAGARKVVTNAQGTFRFDQLPPGTYRLESTLIGFKSITQSISVQHGRTTEVALSLEVMELTHMKDPEADLLKFVARFTGNSPVECGRNLVDYSQRSIRPVTRAQLQLSLNCAENALKERKPFWTFQQLQGIDSWIAEGLLGTQEGDAYRFNYDSAPCGGPGCTSRFAIERCLKPTVVIDQSGPGFRCGR